MATEPTESTDPLTTVFFGFHPTTPMILDPRWRLDETGQKTLGGKRKNKTKWVVVGFSVGSVDSVAIWGGVEGPGHP